MRFIRPFFTMANLPALVFFLASPFLSPAGDGIKSAVNIQFIITWGWAFSIAAGFGWIYFRNWQKNRAPVQRWPTDQDLADELHEWLRREQFQLQEHPQPGTSFSFFATEPITARALTIVKVIGDIGFRIAARVQPTVDDRIAAEALSEKAYKRLQAEIGLELARYGVGFDAIDLLDAGPNGGVRIETGVIPTDAMTAPRFLERVGFVSRAILLVQCTIGVALLRDGAIDDVEPEGG